MAEGGVSLQSLDSHPSSNQETEKYTCNFCDNQFEYRRVSPMILQRCVENHKVCLFCLDLLREILDPMQTCPICDGTYQLSERPDTNSRRNLLVITDTWDDIMSSTSTVAQCLVRRLSDLGGANIFCLVERAQRIDKINARAIGVILLECSSDDEIIAILRDQIGDVDTLIGFFPSRFEIIESVSRAFDIRKIIIINTDATQRVPLAYRFVHIMSLGPMVHPFHAQYIGDQYHTKLYPPLDHTLQLNIREQPKQNYNILFPMIIKDGRQEYLGEHGFDTGFSAVHKLITHEDSAVVTVTLLVSIDFMPHSAEIMRFAMQFGIFPVLRPCCSKLEWLNQVKEAQLALCTSRTAPYQHWVNAIMDQNVPFLVSSQSGMGHILSETHEFAVVNTNSEYQHGNTSDDDNWFQSMKRALENIDETMVHHCHGNRTFFWRYQEGYMPIYSTVLEVRDLALIPVGLPNEENVRLFTKDILRKFTALREFISVDMLEISKQSVIAKCISRAPFGISDLEVEKAMIKTYRLFQSLELKLLRVDEGSLVLKILALTKKAAKRLEYMYGSGELLNRLKQNFLGNDVLGVNFELDLRKTCIGGLTESDVVPSKYSETISKPAKDSDTTLTPTKDSDTTLTPIKDSDTITTPIKDSDTTSTLTKDSDTTSTPTADSDTTSTPPKDLDVFYWPCKAPVINLTESKDVGSGFKPDEQKTFQPPWSIGENIPIKEQEFKYLKDICLAPPQKAISPDSSITPKNKSKRSDLPDYNLKQAEDKRMTGAHETFVRLIDPQKFETDQPGQRLFEMTPIYYTQASISDFTLKKLSRSYASIWTTQNPTIFALGSIGDRIITLVNDTGEILHDKYLAMEDLVTICSGLWIRGKKHMVVAKTISDSYRGEQYTGKAYEVELDEHHGHIYEGYSKNTDQKCPLSVFDINQDVYGMFSISKDPQCHIDIYEKHGDHQHGKTTNVECDRASMNDKVAPSSNGGWLIASKKNSVIYYYDSKGDFMNILGSKTTNPITNIAGHLYSPVDIRVSNNSIVILCQNGVVHRYERHWSILMDFQRNINNMCQTDSRMLTISRNEMNIFYI